MPDLSATSRRQSRTETAVILIFISRYPTPSAGPRHSLYCRIVKEICDYAARHQIRIACENSGSISKNDFVLMNTADEFLELFERVDYPGLGILLDTGHLKLSSKVNHFKPEAFIAAVHSRILEVHVHENNGINDQHSFLYPGCDALRLLKPFDFSKVILTLESRNLTPDQIRIHTACFAIFRLCANYGMPQKQKQCCLYRTIKDLLLPWCLLPIMSGTTVSAFLILLFILKTARKASIP